MKGFTTPKIEGKFSLRASITGQIAMDDIQVPKANLLPKVQGLKVYNQVVSHKISRSLLTCSGSIWLFE